MAGRGIDAASIMGRLATALRAYLLDGHTPESAVSALDNLMKAFEAPTLATLFVLSLDPARGRAEYVRAGHPPALLRRPDGEVLVLTGEGSPPVGPLRGPRFLANEIEIGPGSTLLLYTDGLIERRRVDLQVGIDRLQAAFATAPDDPQAVVDAIPEALGAEGVADDIALLAVRLT
jgi:serine phosphatase RsbU (regulator of sigma subunit)